MSLDADARRRYARQILLGEIGESGQERLLAAEFHCVAEGDARACAVAAEYLNRAGCSVHERGASLRLPTTRDVRRLAGSSALEESAATIMGAFSAVEHLKEVLGVGVPSDMPSELRLSDEG